MDRAFRRAFLYASVIAFVLMVGLVILYLLAIVALSGCGAAGGC